MIAKATALLLLLPFVSAAQNYRIAFTDQRNGQYGTYVSNSDGSGLSRLTDSVLLMSGGWSPDGQRIAFFDSRRDDKALQAKYPLALHLPLYVMNADGSNQHRMLDVPVALGSLRWSPDGKSILFGSSYEDPNRDDPAVKRGAKGLSLGLYVLDAETGRYRRLTGLPQLLFSSWSPDGKEVVFSSGSGQAAEIYVVSANGGNARKLTNLGRIAMHPVWAPDGQRVAFSWVIRPGLDPRDDGTYVIDRNGLGRKRISTAVGNISWAPDGKRLLISGEATYIVNDDGSNQRKPELGQGRVLDVEFSPDGRRIVYRSNGDGTDRVFTINVDGSGRRALSEGVPGGALFVVSPLLGKAAK